MAKEIALKLKITSDGQEKVISNLKGLEEELAILQEKIKTLDFGSAAFIEATQNISKLRTKIDEVDKATEGIGAEKKFRALGDAINILTGSFQVASGAISLFISDEESLEEVQRAEKAALDVLNVALGVNAINTALVESATLRATIATKLNEAATKAASVATAAWNFVLSLNPAVAIAAGVAVLTAAIYGLVKAVNTDTSAQAKNNEKLKAQANLEKDLITEKRKAAVQLKQQLTILTDNVRTRELENQTLEDLKKTYPGLNAFIDKNNQLTADGIKFIRLQIAAEEARAVINKLNERRLEAEIDKETALQDLKINGASLVNKAIAATNGFITAEQLQTAKIYEKYEKQTAGLDAVQQKYTQSLNNTLKELAPLVAKTEERAKADENAAKAVNNNVKQIDKYLEALKKRNDEVNKIKESLVDIGDLAYTSELLNKQKEVIQQQEQFLKETNERFKTSGEKLIDEINNYLFKTIPNQEELAKLTDNYSTLFDTIKEAYRTGELDFTEAFGFDKFVNFAEAQIPGIATKLANVNEESKKSFVEYFNSLKDRLVDIEKIIGTEKKGLLSNLFPEGDKQLLNNLITAEEEIGKLRTAAIEDGLTENQVRVKSLQIIEDRLGIDAKIREIGLAQFEIQMRIKDASAEEIEKGNAQIQQLEETKKAYNGIAETLLGQVISVDKFIEGFEKVNKLGKENLAIIDANKAKIDAAFDPKRFEGLTNYFKENAGQYEVILQDILDNSQKYFDKFGEQGVQAIFTGVAAGIKEIDNKTRPELEKLKKDLKGFGDAVANVFKLKGGNPFAKAIDDIDKKLRKLPTAAEEAFSKSINKIKELTDAFTGALNEVSSRFQSIIQAQNSLYLEELEYRKEQELAIIGEANTGNLEQDKRIEAERLAVQKDYEQKKFEIEKKARIQELEFALANTLVGAAQAVVNALTIQPLPLGIALSAVVAGLTAAQIAVINDQIQFTKNKTYIGRTGGLVEGSSHDTYGGGVPTMLEGGEFILNKEAVRAYGDQIQAINTATGGKPMAIDDSRLIQAIAKQNLSTKTPLKAYVLYNDIQDTTKLNNKIEKLARL